MNDNVVPMPSNTAKQKNVKPLGFQTLFDQRLENDDLADSQKTAITDFVANGGLPNKFIEAFKYTDLSRLNYKNYQLSTIQASGELPFEPAPVFEDSHKIFILNFDVFYFEESLKEIAECIDIKLESNKNYLNNLCLSLCDETLQITLEKDQVLDKPIEIFYFAGEQTSVNGHVSIQLGQNAQAEIVEHFISDENAYSNFIVDIALDKNASLQHTLIQDEDETSSLTITQDTQIARDASYESFTLAMGAEISRREVHSHLNAENAYVSVSGAHLVDGQRLTDASLYTYHHAPHCNSRQHYKTVLTDKAQGVFQGKIYVERDAQKTDGYQLNNALLLSKTSQMNSKPELEIYADDVICTHGATTGQIDKNALFYLRSRGLNEEEARALLVQAFIGQALADIKNETIRDYCENLAQAWLENIQG